MRNYTPLSSDQSKNEQSGNKMTTVLMYIVLNLNSYKCRYDKCRKNVNIKFRHITRFWNNLHQVHLKSKDWRTKWFQSLTNLQLSVSIKYKCFIYLLYVSFPLISIWNTERYGIYTDIYIFLKLWIVFQIDFVCV